MNARIDSLEALHGDVGEHVRLVELQKLRAGELGAEEVARVEAHAARCTSCTARMNALDEEARRLFEAVDVGTESAKILARLEVAEGTRASLAPTFAERLRGWLRRPELRLAAAACAVLLVAAPIVATMMRSGPGELPHGTRMKGSAGLELFVKDAAGVRQANEGETLRAGDQIQLRYRAAGKQFVFVVSASGTGELSPLWPDGPGESVPVTPSGTHVLDGSVILDDAKGPERVIALFSEKPLSYGDVRALLEPKLRDAHGPNELGELTIDREGVDAATFLFRKE